jgi:serine/threonine protein kinase
VIHVVLEMGGKESLHTLISKRKIKIRNSQVRSLTRQLISAVEHMHRN